MPACLPVVLSLPLLFSSTAHHENHAPHLSASPRTTRLAYAWTGIPASMVPALPGITLGPEPRVTGISYSSSPSFGAVFLGERSEVSPGRFHIHLNGLLRNA